MSNQLIWFTDALIWFNKDQPNFCRSFSFKELALTDSWYGLMQQEHGVRFRHVCIKKNNTLFRSLSWKTSWETWSVLTSTAVTAGPRCRSGSEEGHAASDIRQEATWQHGSFLQDDPVIRGWPVAAQTWDLRQVSKLAQPSTSVSSSVWLRCRAELD